MAEYEYHYSRFPALAAYIDRIGAEQINFRRFVVRKYQDQERRSGYCIEKVVIKIVDGCEIDCKVEDYKPTDQEAEAIAAELAGVKWPISVHASYANVEDLRVRVKERQAQSKWPYESNLYVFRDPTRTEVIMCQECRKYEGNRKAYVPYTLFTADGGSPKWRDMEPDGPLPFWKPRVRRNKALIMVHEGAKAAEFVDNLVNDPDPEWRARRKQHPWIEQLSRFEHWGAIGGALAMHRCDYEELRKEGVRQAYYVCDNDNPGRQAAQTFSRMWKGQLVILRWDTQFEAGWDLADEVPEKVRKTPMMPTFAAPATWATKKVGEIAGGRAQYGLSEAFADEWVHVSDVDLYISVDFPMLVYNEKQFDHYYACFAARGARVSQLVKDHHASRVELVNYRPDLSPGVHTNEAGKQFFNIYVPRKWESYKQAPDVGPWEDFLTRVFVKEFDRTEVERWLATFIARPDIKMAYGLLLISEMQGVGKTTLCDILADIIGQWNASYVGEHQILGRWTGWREKRLVICPEIYQGHSSAAYNVLKEVNTDKRTRVEKKFLEEYYIDNRTNIVACSNSMLALKLDHNDRRWLVPEVTELKQEHQYWVGLRHWLEEEDGLRKIVWWADDYLKTHEPVPAGAEPPWTQTKTNVIDSFRNEEAEFLYRAFAWVAKTTRANCNSEIKGCRVTIDGETIVTEGETLRVAALAHAGVEMILLDTDGVKAITTILYEGRIPPKHLQRAKAVRKTASEAGLYVAKQRVGRSVWHNAYVITTSRVLFEMDQNELAEAYADAAEELIGEEKMRTIRLKSGELIRVAKVKLDQLARWWGDM